jgi:hypothetical protein
MGRWEQRECSMRALAVVVSRIDAEGPLEVAAAKDQQPVEALGSDGANETLGVGVRLRGADRCVDDSDPLAVEDLIKGAAELAVAVVDQKAHSLEDADEAEVARLLGDPGAGRVGRAAGEVKPFRGGRSARSRLAGRGQSA